jgi:hypothetical protein
MGKGKKMALKEFIEATSSSSSKPRSANPASSSSSLASSSITSPSSSAPNPSSHLGLGAASSNNATTIAHALKPHPAAVKAAKEAVDLAVDGNFLFLSFSLSFYLSFSPFLFLSLSSISVPILNTYIYL